MSSTEDTLRTFLVARDVKVAPGEDVTATASNVLENRLQPMSQSSLFPAPIDKLEDQLLVFTTAEQALRKNLFKSGPVIVKAESTDWGRMLCSHPRSRGSNGTGSSKSPAAMPQQGTWAHYASKCITVNWEWLRTYISLCQTRVAPRQRRCPLLVYYEVTNFVLKLVIGMVDSMY